MVDTFFLPPTLDALKTFWEQFCTVSQGLVLTLQLLAGGMAIGLILGVCLTLLRSRPGVGLLVRAFISLVRGTPLILQLSLLYFALPQILNLHLPMYLTGIFIFGLNSSAYVAEIFTMGMENIPRGQFEACKTLHISPFAMWKDIIMPQLLRITTPGLVHESIALAKETPLISIIGGLDLMRQAQCAAAEHFTYFTPLLMAAFYYYFIVLLLETLGAFLKKRNHHALSA